MNFFLNKATYEDPYASHRTLARLWNDALEVCAEKGNLSMVMWCIENGATEWKSGMVGAARGGHKELVTFFIEKGAQDWGESLKAAAFGGKLELVRFFLEKCGNKASWYVGYALHSAIQGGNTETIEFLLGEEKSYRVANNPYMDDIATQQSIKQLYNSCMISAVEANNKALVEQYAQLGGHDWNTGLMHATNEGNLKLVEFFIQKGATNNGFLRAARYGHKELVQYFLEVYGDQDARYALVSAAEMGHQDIIELLIQKRDFPSAVWDQAIEYAYENGHKDVAVFLERKAPRRKKHAKEKTVKLHGK